MDLIFWLDESLLCFKPYPITSYKILVNKLISYKMLRFYDHASVLWRVDIDIFKGITKRTFDRMMLLGVMWGVIVMIGL